MVRDKTGKRRRTRVEVTQGRGVSCSKRLLRNTVVILSSRDNDSDGAIEWHANSQHVSTHDNSPRRSCLRRYKYNGSYFAFISAPLCRPQSRWRAAARSGSISFGSLTFQHTVKG